MRITFTFLAIFFINIAFAQDAYHSDFLDYLKDNYGLENPEFCLANNEVGVINDMSIYGGSSSSVSDISDFNFTKVTTLDVPSALNNQWDSGYNTRNKTAVQPGDVILISFWAKRNSADSELFIFAENATDYEKEFYFSFGLTPDWTQYFMAFETAKGYGVNNLAIGLHLASISQNFDIAGLTMLNFKNNYDLDDVPSSFDNGSYEGSDPDAEWRSDAANRIELLRKSDLTIKVVNEQGQLIEGADVSIEMMQHKFGFGSAFVTCRFPGNDCYNATYAEKVFDLDGKGHGFNVGVTENSLKWDGWEEEWIGSPTETVNAIEYLHDNGVTMRGHTLIWPGFSNMPDDIFDNRNNLEYLRSRLKDRISEMVNHPKLKNIISEWDILNEITTNRDLEASFKNDPNFSTGREIYQEIFEEVRALDEDLKLYVNDYVVLSGGGSSSSVINRYKDFLTEINNSSQPLDGIGFQCHIGSNPTSILKLKSVLDDFYDTYQVPFKITEYDLNELVSDDVAAQYLSDFLTMIFSHEAVDAFIMWGFWDGNHWKGNAPMFEEDWTLKPSGQAFIDKVFNEWWTNETGITTNSGNVTFRGFKGLYKVTVSKDGISRTAQVALDDNNEIQLLLEGVTSLDELKSSDFVLSPNPISDGYFVLAFPEEIGKVNVNILNVDGRKIMSKSNLETNSKIEIDLTSGLYLLQIENEDSSVIKKIVIE